MNSRLPGCSKLWDPPGKNTGEGAQASTTSSFIAIYYNDKNLKISNNINCFLKHGPLESII